MVSGSYSWPMCQLILGGVIDWSIGRPSTSWMSFPPVILSLTHGRSRHRPRPGESRHRACGLDPLRTGGLGSEVLILDTAGLRPPPRVSRFTHWQTVVREGSPATMPLRITRMSLEMAISAWSRRSLSFVVLGVKRTNRLGQNDRRCAASVYHSP